MTRSQLKRKFCQFAKSRTVVDFRDTLKARAERHARKYGYAGRKAVFL